MRAFCFVVFVLFCFVFYGGEGGKSNLVYIYSSISQRGRRGRDHIVVGFITTYVIRTYHH